VSGEHPSAVHTLGLRGRAAHTESMSNLHSRVSAGVPRGGQFAATAHAETDVTLSSETGPAPDTSWPRIDRGECWTQPQQPKPGQSLAERFPAVAAQWHPTKNGTLTSSRVKGGARQNVWWVCQKGHEWQSPVNNRIAKGRGCPVCAGQKNGCRVQRPHHHVPEGGRAVASCPQQRPHLRSGVHGQSHQGVVAVRPRARVGDVGQQSHLHRSWVPRLRWPENSYRVQRPRHPVSEGGRPMAPHP